MEKVKNMINNLIRFFLLRNTLFLKIILVFTLPALGMLYFSTILVYEKINTLSEVDDIQRNVRYIAVSEKLIHSLQKERGYSAIYLSSSKFKKELLEQRKNTDKYYKVYLSEIHSTNFNDNLSSNNKKLQNEFYKIESLRKEIDTLKINPIDVMERYSQINSFLLDNTVSLKIIKYLSEFNQKTTNLINLLLVKENAALERGYTSIFLFDKYNKEIIKSKLHKSYTLQDFNLKQFLLKASIDEVEKYNFEVKYLIKKEILSVRNQIENNNKIENLSVNEWWKLSSQHINALEEVYNYTSLETDKLIKELEKNAYFSQVFSLTFLLVSFLTLISLFFVLRNIILNEQKSFNKIKKQQDVYKLLNKTNKLLLKIDNEKELFLKICKLIAENPSMSFGFIYKIIDKDNYKLIAKESTLKDILAQKLDEKKEESVLLQEVVNGEKNFIIEDFDEQDFSILSDVAKNYDLKSAAAFPIRKFNKIVSVIVLYSNEKNFFDSEVEILFEKMINDMTHALEKIEYEKIRIKQENDLRLASYAFEANEPMIITDSDSIIISANNAFCNVMGYTKDDVIGKKPSIFRSKHQGREFYNDMWKKLINDGFWTGELYNTKKDKSKIPLRSTITAIKDKTGKITHYLGQYIDISVQKDKQKVLEYQATHDMLTGLPNRLLLLDRIEHSITRAVRHNTVGGLVFIDLDNFKLINDTLGHDVGDTLLITVAQKLKETVREEDTISRIGGDEFIILADCIGQNKDEAKHNMQILADKIKDALNSIEKIDGHKNISTPSIGVTLFNDASISPKAIIKQADTAMYEAKRAGKNTIEFFI